MISISGLVRQSTLYGQDAIYIDSTDEYTVCLVADGSGGISGGLEASQLLCDLVKNTTNLNQINSPDDMESIVRDFDKVLCEASNVGESTAVLFLIRGDQVIGASVGDSECWLIGNTTHYEITKFQYRKPLLGSGSAVAIGFGPFEIENYIVAGSDGIFNYLNLSIIKDIILNNSARESIPLIVKQAEFKDGSLHDDISLIVGKMDK